MSIKNLVNKMNKISGYCDETPRDRHRREIAAEILEDAYCGKGISEILSSGNITARTKFLRIREMRLENGKSIHKDKWVYTSSADKLLVYITEVVLRFYLCRVLNLSFNDSLERSLIDLVTKYELSGGDFETVRKLENLVFDEYDMVSSPDTPTEKKVMAFLGRYNEAVKAVVKDKKKNSVLLLECTRNIPSCIAERKPASRNNVKIKYA